MAKLTNEYSYELSIGQNERQLWWEIKLAKNYPLFSFDLNAIRHFQSLKIIGRCNVLK